MWTPSPYRFFNVHSCLYILNLALEEDAFVFHLKEK